MKGYYLSLNTPQIKIEGGFLQQYAPVIEIDHTMINTEPLVKITKCILASGKLKDDRPLSAIFIAPVEVGKSSIIRKVCLKADGVFYTTDATAYGIIRDSNNLKDFEEGRYTHIVIPDLITCLGRKQDTVRTFIGFMNALTEEGVVNVSTYATKITKVDEDMVETKAGVITAIPREVFGDKRHHWTRIGFLSRALPVTYDYSMSTRMEILDFIEDQKHLKNVLEELKLPKKSKIIRLPKKIAKKLEPYSLTLANAQKVYGFRHQRQLQTFLKSIALLDGKDDVDQSHFDKFERLVNYINLDFNYL